MDFVANVFGWLAVAYFVSIPFIWIWVFYHKTPLYNLLKQPQHCLTSRCKTFI